MRYIKTIILLLPFLLISCSIKNINTTKRNINKFTDLEQNLMTNCQAVKTFQKNSDSIFIQTYPNYIHINLGNSFDFNNNSTLLLEETKAKLECISSILKTDKKLFVVITAHVKQQSNTKVAQHISDNRAINTAEFLYNNGLRNDTYVKGCADHKIQIDTNNNFTGDKINIYIYRDKTLLQNHCK